jgi:hypothetical protein
VIRYAEMDVDHTNRPDSEHTIEALKSISLWFLPLRPARNGQGCNAADRWTLPGFFGIHRMVLLILIQNGVRFQVSEVHGSGVQIQR